MTTPPLGRLPYSVRYPLLCAAVGKNHLARTAELALAAAEGRRGPEPDGREALATPAELVGLAKELFTAAWLEDPLDGVMAANLADFEARLPGLSPAAAKCLGAVRAVCATEAGREAPARLKRLEEAGDYPALKAWLQKELRAEPGAGFLAWTLYYHAMAAGDPDTARDLCDALGRIAPMAPVLEALRAEALLLAGEPAGALAGFEAAEAVFPGCFEERSAEALRRLGREEEGLSRLRRAVAGSPWRVNAALRLFDLAEGRDRALAPLGGSLAVLLYSHANAARLEVTLAALADSDLTAAGRVLVRVLVNGRDDAAEAVIGRFAARLGERFGSVLLPVNVGAAPARNWLMDLPEVQACDFAAYLDDDARVPADWLGRFGAAAAAYPEAGLWGCRVVDFERPANAQQTDLNLLPPRTGEALFSITDAQLHGFDSGRFAYLRPCSSVTGCCHLFRTRELLRCGAFDIRFSPTQYDDLDHDLRLGLMGIPVVCQGHLAVEHMKVSGRSLHKSRAASANAAANMYKLKSKYSEREIEGLRRRAAAFLEEDLAGKLAGLGLA